VGRAHQSCPRAGSLRAVLSAHRPHRQNRDAWPQYELLLRMRDEKGDLVPTTTFIPAAERYNLMPSLDRWVISHVLEELIYRGNDRAAIPTCSH
jgi:EAL domain-containing protein (putative c-di-GMP-specific phosphodiesterase class I)